MKIKTVSEYCLEQFGTKVYRLSLSTGCTCPNRDGTAGYGGCTFCSESGSGEFAVKGADIDRQIEDAKKRIIRKMPKSIAEEDRRYIAYFQSYTNTYGSADRLLPLFEQAISRKDICALSVATRPDCLKEDMLEGLAELNRKKPVWIELGLQTIHEKSAERINRGYGLSVFEEAYRRLKQKGLTVIAHIILGLPYESREEMLETVRYLSDLDPVLDGIKIHGLQILKGTKLAQEYMEHPFPVMTLAEYTELLITCLKLLPSRTVVHRMTGDGDKRLLIEPQWSADKKRVLNEINRCLKEA